MGGSKGRIKVVVSKNVVRGGPIPTNSGGLVVRYVLSCLGDVPDMGMIVRDWGGGDCPKRVFIDK